MDLSAFFTLPNNASTIQNGVKPAALSGQGSSGNFMDIFLANVLKAQNLPEDNNFKDTEAHDPLKSDNQSLAKDEALSLIQSFIKNLDASSETSEVAIQKLASDLGVSVEEATNIFESFVDGEAENPEQDIMETLLKALAANEDIAEDVQVNAEVFNTTLDQDIQATLALNAQTFNEIIAPLKTTQESLNLEEKQLENLSLSDLLNMSDGEIDDKDVYKATGLLQAIMAKHKMLAKNPIVNSGNLTPEQLTQAVDQIKEAIKQIESSTGKPVTDITQILNPQTIAAIQKIVPQITFNQSPKQLGNSFGTLVEQVNANEGSALPSRTDVKLSEVVTTKVPTEKQMQDLIKAFKVFGQGVLDGTQMMSSAEQTDLNSFFDDLPPALKADASPLTNSVTASSVRAGQSHPATQAVIITMQKTMGDGQPKNFTLQLDPPELGRVEVKMHFDKTSKMKTVMTIEKPETFALLQRDAHSLERAMQDMGIETDGAMNFELADDSHHFNQDGRHDGSRHQANGKSGTEYATDEMEIIQTTMTWDVDPNTGHIHYSILV